jgi:hypothetical protein
MAIEVWWDGTRLQERSPDVGLRDASHAPYSEDQREDQKKNKQDIYLNGRSLKSVYGGE